MTQDILCAAQNGDREAVSMLVRHWHRPVRAFVAAMLLGSQDADDIAQEVFVRAIERLDCVVSVDAIGPFLRGVARNVIREQQRKYVREGQAYRRLVEERIGSGVAVFNESSLSDPELIMALKKCLGNLPQRAREMLAFRYDNDLNSHQIGERMGMAGPAVRAAMRRARIALLDCIRSSYSPAIDLASVSNIDRGGQ